MVSLVLEGWVSIFVVAVGWVYGFDGVDGARFLVDLCW